MIGVGLDADRDQDLDERPVGDPLAVARGSGRGGRRPSRRRARGSRRRGGTCRCRPGRAGVKSLAGAVGDGVLVVAPQALSLALSSDQRSLEVSRERRGVADDLEQAEGLDRLGLPLERERLDRPRRRTASRTRSRVSAPMSTSPAAAACSRRAATLTASPVTSVSPSPPTTTSPVLTPIRASSPCSDDRRSHLRGGSDSAERVVLVRDRNPEDGHHRVADELLDGAAVALDDRAEILEVAAHARSGAPPDRSTRRARSSRRGRRRGS